jgi:hypothetical protein
VTLALALLAAAVLAPGIATPTAGARRRAWARRAALVLVLLGVLHDAVPVVDLGAVEEVVARVPVLGLGSAADPLFVLAALVWCGPAADLLVRRILDATGLPAPEAAAAAGFGAGRWIGRLERWLLVVCVAAGQPALAVIPIGGKALFRYAEVVADARAARPRLTPAGAGDGPVLSRDALVDYVIVGSLASWTQGIVLGVLAAAS